MTEHESAKSWLALLDASEFEVCWHNAAAYFKDAVSLDDWKEKITHARNGVGQLRSREIKSATEADDLNGITGKFLVIEYNSVFTKAGEIGERLTLLQEEDDHFRAVGYYLV